MLVVNDQPLADAIGRLRGEWAERSGGAFSATAIAWTDLIGAESPEADVIVFPSRYLGELCERKWLRPVRESVLQGDSLNAQDVFPLIYRQLCSYDRHVMSLPLGVDLPVLCYRRGDIAEQRKPPATWEEYRDMIAPRAMPANVEQDPPLGWEPLRVWGAVMLLSRVATFVRDADQGGALFDPQTMRPRLTGPPFLRALEELQAAAHSMRLDPEPQSEIERRQIDPRAASRRIAAGETLLAIGLPPAGHREFVVEVGTPQHGDGTTQVAWTQLPGSIEVYNHLAGVWEKLDRAGRAPVLGVGDRLTAVTTSSRNAATAFQLLAWLTEPEVSSKFARAGDGTMPVRRSLAASPQWYDQKLSAAERSDLAKVLNDSLSGELCLIVPRIPGVDEYMAALAEAVEDVIFEQAEPKAALEKAAATWELITERRGRDAQRQAYLRHLGIDQNVVGTLRVP